jgi:hypothetical protein
MPDSDVVVQSVEPSTRTWRSRLRAYLVRRTRQLARLLLGLVVALLFMAGVIELWRGVSLLGLPDIGDPFDVEAFQSLRIPEQQDSIVLLRKAQEKLTGMPSLSRAELSAALNAPWSKTAPELREWATANRRVLELFRTASERPDGIMTSTFDQFGIHYHLSLGDFCWLAILEASRLEEQGDMAGAWNWYQAVLRMKTHVMRRGSVFQRYIAERSTAHLRPRIAAWAADKRTSESLLRRALGQVVAGEPRPERDANSLKVEYLAKMYELDAKWGIVQQGDDEEERFKIAGEDLPPNLAWIPYATKRYFANDPERSRRVLRLAFANWLAHAEEKDARYLKPAARARIGRGNSRSAINFYDVSQDAPAAARRLTPEDLAKALIRTRDAKLLLRFWPWPAVSTTERREHRALVVLLASELYERDHGKPAASERALVGGYLDYLPSDGSEEQDDGAAAEITDETIPPGEKPD